MNEYTIDWLEKKEWQGKKLIDATLQGEGTVTIWELDKDGKQFPGFSDLAPGGKVQGNIWANPTNGKKTLYPPKPQTSGGYGAASRGGGGVKAAQERKAEMIEKAQDRKEDSIAYFNAINSSIALLPNIYELQGAPPSTIRAYLTDWRDWFLKEHQNYKEKPPF